MFYQYNPEATVSGLPHWGLAISTDLVHWEELPVALYPNDLGAIFSGSAVVDSQNTTGLQTTLSIAPIILIFTQQGNYQTQGIAVSNDRGRTFEMYSGNPVMPNNNKIDFRDHPKNFTIDKSDKWFMALAVTDKIEFYSSNDLKNWTELS